MLVHAGRSVWQQLTFNPIAPFAVLGTFVLFIAATYIPAVKGDTWVAITDLLPLDGHGIIHCCQQLSSMKHEREPHTQVMLHLPIHTLGWRLFPAPALITCILYILYYECVCCLHLPYPLHTHAQAA